MAKDKAAELLKLFRGKRISIRNLNTNGWKTYANKYSVWIRKDIVNPVTFGKYRYSFEIYFNDHGTISDIDTLHCELLLSNDPCNFVSKDVPVDSDDYKEIEELLKGALLPNQEINETRPLLGG